MSQNVNTNPFIEFDWINEWWKHLGEGKNIEIIVVIKNNEVIAFFPFLYKKKGWVYTYSFIGIGHANYMDFISYEHSVETVIEFVMDYIIHAKKHVVFNLHGLLESSFSHRKLEVYLRKRKFRTSTHRVITPYINLDKIQMEEYIKKRQKLHRLDRREKRIRANGLVEVALSGPEEMEKIFKIHDKRWKKKHDTSGFTNIKERKFYESLAKLQGVALTTEIDGLYMDGNMIAFNYGYQCRGRYISYVLGFDDDYEVFSPGRILEKEKILQCSERKIKIFDLSIGYETYKFEWNTDLDYTKKIIFSNNTFFARLVRQRISTKETFISRIKVNQKLVLFKRNKIGKVLYVLRNIFTRENYRETKQVLTAFLIPKLKFLFQWKQYFIYEIERKNVSNVIYKNNIIQLTIKEANNSEELVTHHMRDICTKIYGAYKGYYPIGKLFFKEIFWTNEKVIRIDDISYLKDFRKSSIFIENWRVDNLKEICAFIKNESNANKLYLCVKASSKQEISEIENLGFSLHQKIIKKSFLGFSKVIVE
ncbi:GNAT family N-acetyltransferase [Bacillus sp. Cr_A10]|uniref:GNAT family N-acetyltransferase n=1 Tax=Bacillus sp. Cr_A10 TaxID=3033993 RepID=UPI0023DB89D2|nr:GNAT family N-acetyltransferase [Bacillus sp. Cr_A10]MDF2065061.1 GNAT family N-acetyltransferase [Bacillus sp. Cr_A10]